MAQIINTNIASLNAQRHLNSSQGSLQTSLTRLSSGLRINSAKDDAAGLAISERFSTQIRGINVATRNANDGISLAQTAEGALGEVTNNLQRIRELAVQARNATNSVSDRAALDAEVQQRIAEINRVAGQTQFNGLNLLDGSFTEQVFQVGANFGQTISVDAIAAATGQALGLAGGVLTDHTATGGLINGTNLIAGDLKINDIDIGAVDVTTGYGGASALAVAINAAAGQTGVRAEAEATEVTGDAPTGLGAFDADSLTINGVGTAAVDAGSDAAGQAANVSAAINAIADQTGVTASVDGSNAIVLSAADGRSIEVAFAATGGNDATTALTGLTAATTYSSVKLSGEEAFTVAGNAKSGLASVTSSTATDTSYAAINVKTASAADTVLRVIDNALNEVNSSRADLGAVQNRFESVIANLSTTSENLSASRARIMDADFAAETAELTRSQILQQAGTAMLAQANSLPQNVLSLLR